MTFPFGGNTPFSDTPRWQNMIRVSKNHPHLRTYLGNQIRELVHVVLSCFIGWTVGPPILFEMLVPLLHFCWDCPAVGTKGTTEFSDIDYIFVSSGSKPFDLWSPIKFGFSHVLYVLPPFSLICPLHFHIGSPRFPTCSHLRLEAEKLPGHLGAVGHGGETSRLGQGLKTARATAGQCPFLMVNGLD